MIMMRKVALWIGLFVVLGWSSGASANLITNGDFESGNIGFISHYTYSPANIQPDSTYATIIDPSSIHALASSYGDHTTGSGLMMAVNGAPIAGTVVWSQSVEVAANTDYEFSSFVSSWHQEVPAQLGLQLASGGELWSTTSAPATTGIWQEWSASFNSGEIESVNISIVSLSTSLGGNDFALDDISIVAVPEPSTALLLGFGLSALAATNRRRSS